MNTINVAREIQFTEITQQIPTSPNGYLLARECSQPTSEFSKAYSKGLHKSKYWDPMYEDSLNLIAKLPAIAAHIYRTTYREGKLIEADPKLDWAANLSHMMGEQFRLRVQGSELSQI